MRYSALLLGASALLVAAPAAAESASATARASAEVVEVGQRLEYTVEAAVQGNESIRLIKAPTFGVFKVVNHRKMPMRTNINGAVSNRLTLSFTVAATDEGSYRIQPPTFRIGSRNVTANPVSVRVVAKGQGPKGADDDAARRDSRFFIEASIEPNDRDPYIGEQLTLRYDLFVDTAQVSIQPSNSREPSLDEFWIQELTDRVARNDQMVSVRGRLYKRSSMWTYALFPLHAGPVEIEPATVELVTGVLFQRGRSASLKSQSIPLDVQPLPPNAPDGFYEGNIGNWTFNVKTNESNTRVGRAFVVELSATGAGQVSRIRLPELPEIDGTRLSDTDELATPSIRGTTVGGVAKTTYTLTPLREGKLTIPPLTFHWFDPSNGKYKTMESKPLVINVAKGQPGDAPVEHERTVARTTAADEDLIANLTEELLPPRENASTEEAPDPARFPWPYWILIAASFIAFVVVSFGGRVKALLQRAAPQREQRNKAAEAVERLNEATDASSLARALAAGLNDAWDVPRGSVTSSAIERAFAKRDLDKSVAKELADVLADCESARFSPDGGKLNPKNVEKARRALTKLASLSALLLALAFPTTARAQAPENSVDLQYNLGTEAAKEGDYATARLALERAAYLSPWDDQVETNRSLVERIVRLRIIERSRTGRTPEGDEVLFWWTIASHVNPHLLGFATILFWLLAAAGVHVRRKSESPAMRDALIVGLVLALLLALASTFGAVARSRVLASARPVVVLDDDLDLREGPNAAADTKRTPLSIVPGTMLRVVDERGEWVKLAWAEDAGWTHRRNVGDIVPRTQE